MADKLELAKEVQRQSEMRLQAQLTVAIAADQRATRMIGTLMTVSTAVLGAILTLGPQGAAAIPFYVGGVTALGFLLSAAFCCVQTARPARFHFPGSLPSAWRGQAFLDDPLDETLTAHAQENLENYIAFNTRAMEVSASRLVRGLKIAALAPFAGITAWAAAWAAALAWARWVFPG